MLYAIGAFFLVLWIIGLALKVTSAVIHVALVVALAMWLWGFFKGRTGRGPTTTST